MSNKTLAKLWATQARESGKGSNFFFEGTKLYSYGYHFLVAEIVDGKAVFNPARYSQSTTRHQSLALQAASAAGRLADGRFLIEIA